MQRNDVISTYHSLSVVFISAKSIILVKQSKKTFVSSDSNLSQIRIYPYGVLRFIFMIILYYILLKWRKAIKSFLLIITNTIEVVASPFLCLAVNVRCLTTCLPQGYREGRLIPPHKKINLMR